MIAIVNVSSYSRKTGWHEYEVRINQKIIAKFGHRREEDLAVCLRRAVDAVEQRSREKVEAA